MKPAEPHRFERPTVRELERPAEISADDHRLQRERVQRSVLLQAEKQEQS